MNTTFHAQNCPAACACAADEDLYTQCEGCGEAIIRDTCYHNLKNGSPLCESCFDNEIY